MLRNLMVLDSAYPYKVIKERNVEDLVTGRDLGGFFNHVWSCNPVGSILEPEDSPARVGRVVKYSLSEAHTIVEGKLGRFRWLSFFSVFNFFVSQVEFLIVLVRIVRDNDIKVIRAEDPLYNGILALFVSRICRVPLMIGVWGNPGEVRKNTGAPLMPKLFKKVWVEEAVESFVLKKATIVMVQNEDNKKFVLSKGILERNIRIFRLGNLLHPLHFSNPVLRCQGVQLLTELGVVGDPTILVISRLQKLKLVDHVILAYKLLVERGVTAKLLFVGDGGFRAEMEMLAKQLGVDGHIIFCGNRDQIWLAQVIPAVSVVVSPLTGRALAEAALGGAPVVAYDIDWHSELIETDKTGFLVPYLNYEAMAVAIEAILTNIRNSKNMGDALRKRALELLDPVSSTTEQKATYDIFYSLQD